MGKIRNNINDPNSVNRSSQFGQWCYPDSPKIVKLLNNSGNFPRISVESISHATDTEMGMSCTEHLENINIKITVWTIRDLICTIKDTTAEVHTYDGATKYSLTNQPISVISLVTGTLLGVPDHTFVKNTDYQLIDDTNNGFSDTIEWIGGEKPDVGIFKVSYQRKASADELCRFIAYEINKYLRDNWRDWTENIVWGYRKTGGTPIDFDSEIGVHRYELTCSFNGINIGDSI